MRSIVAFGLFCCLILTLMPLGCADSLERVPLRQPATGNEKPVPEITAARLRECVESYADQLSSQSYRVHYYLKVNDEGRVVEAETDDIPRDAPDFAACTREVLRDMNVPASVMRLRLDQTIGSTNGQTPAARESMGSAAVMGAEVTLEELLAAAGGVNIFFAISIGLAVSGVKDIVEVIDALEEVKAQCHKHYLECLESPLADKYGSVDGATRCLWCREVCVRVGGVWPPRAPKARGWVTCKY